MRYRDDRGGSKLLFLAIMAVFIYLAFFDFNLPAAYLYTMQQLLLLWHSL